MNQQAQPQMTVQDAAQTLHAVILDKTTCTGREIDVARGALNYLVNNFLLLDRVAGALKAAAEKAGVNVDEVIRQAAGQGQAQAPQAAPVVPTKGKTRAEKRRLAAVPAKDAAAQE